MVTDLRTARGVVVARTSGAVIATSLVGLLLAGCGGSSPRQVTKPVAARSSSTTAPPSTTTPSSTPGTPTGTPETVPGTTIPPTLDPLFMGNGIAIATDPLSLNVCPQLLSTVDSVH